MEGGVLTELRAIERRHGVVGESVEGEILNILDGGVNFDEGKVSRGLQCEKTSLNLISTLKGTWIVTINSLATG